uniref:Uncharacterized protein n=1 Tax=Magallana gigas TaxID=29159 RepID=A0A8W8P6P7_MAGGI
MKHTEPDGRGYMYHFHTAGAKTGSEIHHVLLRLLTVLELLEHRPYYDSDHRKHVDLISDNRVVSGTYEQILDDAVNINSYSGMSHIYALSAVLGKPRSYYPPQLAAEFVSEPYTRKAVG